MTKIIPRGYLPTLSLIFYFMVSTFVLSSCSKAPKITNTEKLKPIDRQEINGVLIIHKNTDKSDNGGLSSPEVLKILRQKLADDPLTRGLDVNLTLSFARLTIAGEAYSSNQIQQLVDIALQMPEIKEIICTVIIIGDSDERALL